MKPRPFVFAVLSLAALAGCKGGPGVKVGACYVDEQGREYCVDVEVTPGPDGSTVLPEKLVKKPEEPAPEK